MSFGGAAPSAPSGHLPRFAGEGETVFPSPACGGGGGVADGGGAISGHLHAILDCGPVRGPLQPRAPLASFIWFRTGGPAECLFRPSHLSDLRDLLATLPASVPVLPIGVGSNLIVRDGGVPGLTIRLTKAFADIRVDGRTLRAGAAAMGITVATAARDAGIAGLEFLRGIPGTLGGAVAMNAGAYGREIADVLVEATLALPGGRVVTLPAAELGFAYRHSTLPPGAIVVEALLRGVAGDPAAIGAEMDRIAAEREASQPLRSRTGGSTFRNPPGHKAWALIDAAGCRGLAARRCAGQRETLQLPAQHRRRLFVRHRRVGRTGPFPRARTFGRGTRMGDCARGGVRMTDPDPCDCVEPDVYERELLENIRERGHQITGVSGDPPWAYSIGYWESAGQPEYVVFGQSFSLMGSMIKQLATDVHNKSVEVFDGAEVTGLIDGYTCVLRRVHSTQIVRDIFNSAMWYHELKTGQPLVSVYQIVWPSVRDHLYPWDDDCPPAVSAEQPGLYLPRDPGAAN